MWFATPSLAVDFHHLLLAGLPAHSALDPRQELLFATVEGATNRAPGLTASLAIGVKLRSLIMN
jgi:hypothetical protein